MITPWLVFATFSAYLMGPLLGAKLGMIDDHEIPLFLGSDRKISINEIPNAFALTELANWGDALRYRPSYYTLRILETALWRDNATLWYGTRIIILIVSLWIGWKIMSKYFPEIVSYLFVFYVMTMPFWPDIITRLGPSEIYAIPSLLAFILGVIQQNPGLVIGSYIVAVGAKENLIFLLPILLFWSYNLNKRKALSCWSKVGIIGSIIYSLWIVSSILLATSKAGTDFYVTDISYVERVMTTFRMIPTIIIDRDIIPGLIGLLYFFWIGKKYKYTKYVITNSFGILVIIFSQYVFYNNKIPSLSRYDFPVLVLFPLFNIYVLFHVVATVSQKYKHLANLALCGLIVFMSLAYMYGRGYLLIHRQRDIVVQSSNTFKEKIDYLANTLRQNPETTLVFSSNHFIDFEPITSVERYITSQGVTNRIELLYTPEGNLTEPLAVNLEQRMVAVTQGLSEEGIFKGFDKYTNPSRDCYSISFKQHIPSSCQHLVTF